jgi:bifunctional enzyme CysN/CysC
MATTPTTSAGAADATSTTALFAATFGAGAPGPKARDAARMLDAWLVEHERKELLRFLTCGNVDDGKSTLIGRLLLETDSVPEDVLAAVERESRVRGTQGEKTDLAFLTDGLKAEREQGITIDVAYRTFATGKRRFILADTPGHEQYTRNMATGASTAELAIILIDARNGVTRQTRRHATITSLLGIRQVIVAVNKMDLVGFDHARYHEVVASMQAFAAKLPPRSYHYVPVSALDGDNLVHRSARMPWYRERTVLELLETLPVDSGINRVSFRMPVQLALRPTSDFRGFAGTIASGAVRTGDEIMVLPSGRTSRVARIVQLEPDGIHDRPLAVAPEAATIVLADEIDVSRGDVLCRPDDRPTVSDRFEATIVWMDDAPLLPGKEYWIKQGAIETPAVVARILHRVDIESLEERPTPALELNAIGRIELRTARPLVFDPYDRNRGTGHFILVDRLTNATSGAGLVVASDIGHWLDAAQGDLRPSSSEVTHGEREARYGQKPATILLTGLSGSGKSATARALERQLFDLGRAAVVLDGEGVRAGLSRDLGFSAADRSENLRRATEVARLLNDAGLIAICAFVAPQADVRARCRDAIGGARFITVHLAAPLAACRAGRTADGRPPSAVYADAEAGRTTHVPGIDCVYEPPTDADLVLESHELSAAECGAKIVALLRERGIIG